MLTLIIWLWVILSDFSIVKIFYPFPYCTVDFGEKKQKNLTKLIEKERRFLFSEAEGWGGELDKGGQKIQVSSCKINKH